MCVSEIPHSRHPRHGHSETTQPRCDLNRWEGVPRFRPSRQLLLYVEIWERHQQNTDCPGSFSRRHPEQSWPQAIDTTTVRLPARNLGSADPTVSESWAPVPFKLDSEVPHRCFGEHPFSLGYRRDLGARSGHFCPASPCRPVKCPVFIAFFAAHPSCNTFVIGDRKKRCYNRR